MHYFFLVITYITEHVTWCLLLHLQYSYEGGSRGQPREAWLVWNFQRELWFISFFLRETWLGVPPWNVIGNLYSTWSVIKAPFSTWTNDTNRPKFAYLNDILLMHDTVETIPTTFHWGISRIVADVYMHRVHVLWLPWQRVTTVKRGRPIVMNY